MSIGARLNCDMDASDDEIIEVMRKCGIVDIAKEDDVIEAFSNGIECSIINSLELTKNIHVETFGFAPTRTVGFRLSKFVDYDRVTEQMLRIAASLIKELSADCTLRWYDSMVLWRKEEHVLLCPTEDTIKKAKLELLAEMIGDPFDWGPIP